MELHSMFLCNTTFEVAIRFPRRGNQTPRDLCFISTKINHYKTVQQMIDLYPDCLQWRRQVIKHYRTDLTAQTKGKRLERDRRRMGSAASEAPNNRMD